jgi:hypothetical protein
MKKIALTVLAALVFWSAMGGSAHALGIAPADLEIMFEPMAEKVITIKVLNSGGEEMEAGIYAEGDLAGYVKLNEDHIRFSKGETEKLITYAITFPPAIDEPGDRITRIIITETPKQQESKGTGIRVVSSVGHILKVHVPYPGKYAKARLFVPNFRLNEENNFAIEVTNLGEESIDAAAVLDITGPEGENVTSLESEKVTVMPKDKEILIVKWTPAYRGEFLAKVRVKYDDHSARDEKYITVGELLIDVEAITVDRFFLGEIAKFDILLKSEWNRKVSGIYAQMAIRNATNQTIGDFKTPDVDIEPFEQKTLNAYWDTKGVEKGAYDANIRIHYAGKVTERELRTYVTLESIETEIIGLSARAVSKGGKSPGPGSETALLIVIVAASNLGWVWYFRRKGGIKKG